MITVADARGHLGVESDKDSTLARLIDEATATLGRELNRYLGPPVEQVEIKCGGLYPGAEMLFTNFDPLIDDDHPFEVETRGSATEAWEALEAADYEIDGRKLVGATNFPHGRGTVRISYFSGYVPGQGPGQLRDLVRELVAMRWNARLSGGDHLLKSESMGDYSYTRRDLELLAGWQDVVKRWRRRLV